MFLYNQSQKIKSKNPKEKFPLQRLIGDFTIPAV